MLSFLGSCTGLARSSVVARLSGRHRHFGHSPYTLTATVTSAGPPGALSPSPSSCVASPSRCWRLRLSPASGRRPRTSCTSHPLTRSMTRSSASSRTTSTPSCTLASLISVPQPTPNRARSPWGGRRPHRPSPSSSFRRPARSLRYRRSNGSSRSTAWAARS